MFTFRNTAKLALPRSSSNQSPIESSYDTMVLKEALRNEAGSVWQASMSHPFVREVAAGTLPIEKFIHYIRNDSLYLRAFAQVQALAAAKAPNLQTMGRLAFHAESTSRAEHALHETFFSMLQVASSGSDDLPAPTAYRYITHLHSVAAHGTFAEIIAAILPCYWLYWEIGLHYKNAHPDHPVYNKWIETYGNEWFGEQVKEQIDRVDALADAAGIEERLRMKRHFLISCKYELDFWGMAYQLEKWDVTLGTPVPDQITATGNF